MIFNITDISKIHLVCNKCTTEVIFPVQIGTQYQEPRACPTCGTMFMDYSGGNPPEEAKLAAELLMAIQGFQNIIEGLADFDVLLEISDAGN